MMIFEFYLIYITHFEFPYNLRSSWLVTLSFSERARSELGCVAIWGVTWYGRIDSDKGSGAFGRSGLDRGV